MRRAQHFFPVSQIGNRNFVLFHGKHALRSWISLSFVKRSVHKRSFNTLSGSLHDLVFSYYHSSGGIGIPVSQSLSPPKNTILRSIPSRAVHHRLFSARLRNHPVPNQGIFGFTGMPARIVENEHGDIGREGFVEKIDGFLFD